MIAFVSAFAVFLILHSVPAVPAIRTGIIARVGRPTYFVGYSLVSTIVLIWVFAAALSLDYIPLWELRPWHAGVTFVLAPLGIFLVLAGLLSGNPLSVSVRSGSNLEAVTGITRHPVLWGFALWAIGHLVANGDLRSVLLFGGFAAFALASIPMAEKRAKRRLGKDWALLSAQTSIWPVAAFLRGARPAVDRPLLLAAAFAGLTVAWLLLGGGHSMLFGADPLAVIG
ncbi:NnrU family protein [Rhizobium sp. R72]|uniref:NnrU family protein n=1 Tax=unclassified Rhizobium TaxID=2613769 RepID=UPI000B52BCCB|nr:MULTISPECIES: NnrU family protein [unclassified Rhizobium]OWV97585.1 NnrU family protein [Rhizobium sp. R72]OWV97924.1 NnrU family protein [Rhizobium sp. R711]